MATAIAALQLMRVHNALAASLCVLVGASLAAEPWSSMRLQRLLLALWVVFLVTAGGNAINDYCDLALDRTNKPARPLPSGRLAPASALRIAIAAHVIAVACAAGLGTIGVGVAALMALLAWLYSRALKRTPWASLVVGGMCAMCVPYGALAAGLSTLPILPAVLVFLFVVAREVLKAVEDHAGDEAFQVRTVSTVLGRSRALHLYQGAALACVVATWVPYFTGLYPLGYLVAVLLGTDLWLLRSVAALQRTPTPITIRRTLTLTKLASFGGIGAMLIGVA